MLAGEGHHERRALLLQRQIGQHGGRYDVSTIVDKRREREREGQYVSQSLCQAVMICNTQVNRHNLNSYCMISSATL